LVYRPVRVAEDFTMTQPLLTPETTPRKGEALH